MANEAEAVSRPMKFPYTFTARLAQFPWKFHLNNSWLYRYYFIAVCVSMPIFYKIQKLANSPENKANWAEQKRKEAAAAHH